MPECYLVFFLEPSLCIFVRWYSYITSPSLLLFVIFIIIIIILLLLLLSSLLSLLLLLLLFLLLTNIVQCQTTFSEQLMHRGAVNLWRTLLKGPHLLLGGLIIHCLLLHLDLWPCKGQAGVKSWYRWIPCELLKLTFLHSQVVRLQVCVCCEVEVNLTVAYFLYFFFEISQNLTFFLGWKA